jgi:hypothetical protein
MIPRKKRLAARMRCRSTEENQAAAKRSREVVQLRIFRKGFTQAQRL